MKAKQKVLQELMDMMDSKQLDGMKSKSPKFAKVDIQSDDPMLADKLKDKLMDAADESEDMSEDPKDEMSDKDIKEDTSEGEDPFTEDDSSPMDDDDLQRLKELYARLK